MGDDLGFGDLFQIAGVSPFVAICCPYFGPQIFVFLVYFIIFCWVVVASGTCPEIRLSSATRKPCELLQSWFFTRTNSCSRIYSGACWMLYQVVPCCTRQFAFLRPAMGRTSESELFQAHPWKILKAWQASILEDRKVLSSWCQMSATESVFEPWPMGHSCTVHLGFVPELDLTTSRLKRVSLPELRQFQNSNLTTPCKVNNTQYTHHT